MKESNVPTGNTNHLMIILSAMYKHKYSQGFVCRLTWNHLKSLLNNCYDENSRLTYTTNKNQPSSYNLANYYTISNIHHAILTLLVEVWSKLPLLLVTLHAQICLVLAVGAI